MRRRLAALALAFGFVLGGAEPQPIGDARLTAVATRYFADLWKSDPIRATQVGVHDYDDLLTDESAAAFAERASTVKRFLAESRALDPGSFGAEGSYDRQIFEANLETQLVQLQTRETWRHDPSFYTGRAANAVYALISREFAPLPARVRSIVARERLIPALLDQGRANVTTVDAVTAEIARGNIAGTLSFFSTVVPAAVGRVREPALLGQFKTANDAVVAALKAYADAMDAGPFAKPQGSFAIGSDTFAKLLALQELVPIPLDVYDRVGAQALAQTRAEFVATARAIDATKSPEQVATALGVDHPAEGDLLRTAQADLATLRAFVVAHKLVTLPPDDDVKVVATPEFARATSFASMNSPGPLEKVATQAYYNVTPVEPGWSAERKEQHLSFFNRYAFPLVSLHEVMPGHYVNFALDRHEDLSPIRRLMSSASFAEGWAHYDEQMMVDAGWGDGDPRVRLAQLQLALQRECRYLVGLREHTAGMTVDAATRFFEDNAFMAHEPSRREALRGTQDPLYGYYTLGKLEILKLLADDKKREGSRFSLESFHDALLAHGDPPLAIVRKIVLGADDDGKLL